jgi:hypothetical protein
MRYDGYLRCKWLGNTCIGDEINRTYLSRGHNSLTRCFHIDVVSARYTFHYLKVKVDVPRFSELA